MKPPVVGEVYRHPDGTMFAITFVDSDGTVHFRLLLTEQSIHGRFPPKAWAEIRPSLTNVSEGDDTPSLLHQLKLKFVEHLAPDLRTMQILERSFAMGVGSVGSQNVTVLVAMGDLAETLKQIGLRIHKQLHNGQDSQNPSVN